MISKRTRALQITPKVRQIVRERDQWCVLCGNPYRLEVAHFISRGSGGLIGEYERKKKCEEEMQQ